jgi:HlyD family secretion protein
MLMPKYQAAILIGLALIGAVAIRIIALSHDTQNAPRAAAAAPDVASDNWQAVAPGRVEPRSGEIKIAASMMGRISAVLVAPGDKVFPGEALISFDDAEARARLSGTRAQIAVRKRVRNEQSVTGRALDRRKAEDAVADAADAAVAAADRVDRAAMARRRGTSAELDLEGAQRVLVQAQDRLIQSRAVLRTLEDDPATPLPTQLEGQLNIARTELKAAEAGLERLIIRSPIEAMVLQVNAKVGEFGTPGSPQPLISLGDVSALRVRAEVDEHDYAAIKLGQTAIVRSDASRGRDFTGTVASVAPIVQSGRLGGPGQRSLTDVSVAEVLIDLTETDTLAVGMKVDVYFRARGTAVSAK